MSDAGARWQERNYRTNYDNRCQPDRSRPNITTPSLSPEPFDGSRKSRHRSPKHRTQTPKLKPDAEWQQSYCPDAGTVRTRTTQSNPPAKRPRQPRTPN